MADSDTRDIAIATQAALLSHTQECDRRHERINEHMRWIRNLLVSIMFLMVAALGTLAMMVLQAPKP